MQEIQVEILNADGEIVEFLSVVGEDSFAAISRFADGCGFEVRIVST